MAYLIKTYTFSAAVPSASNYPFVGQRNITFSDAQEQLVYLDDPDALFEPGSIGSEPGQKLLKETVLGGAAMPEGTVLTYNSSRVSAIIDTATGAAYYVVFPFKAGTSKSSMTEIGDRSTVLIIPRTTDTPEFDPSQSYDFGQGLSVTSFRIQPAAIPPNYLDGICFAAGTLIETAQGPRRVEALRPGELVVTRDRGPRPLAWIGGRKVSARMLDIAPNLRPVTIRRGALGRGLPAQDLTLSPQHRVLVESRIAERIAGAAETLVAVKHLCDLPGIAVSPAPGGINYHHLLFDRHELVMSNGCWTESLFTGPQAMRSIGPSARREIAQLFPQLFAAGNAGFDAARPFMAGREARELTRRHLKNAKPLLA